jgi:hypothetical protein
MTWSLRLKGTRPVEGMETKSKFTYNPRAYGTKNQWNHFSEVSRCCFSRAVMTALTTKTEAFG